MTTENQNLIENNMKLVYKFCVNHNIKDEDVIQDLFMHLCDVIEQYDSTKSAFSTWVYTICLHHLYRMHYRESTQSRTPTGEVISLDITIENDKTGGISSMEELIGTDDVELARMEDKILVDYIIKRFKELYPKNADRDLDIFLCYTRDKNRQDVIAKKYNITKQRVSQIYARVKNSQYVYK